MTKVSQGWSELSSGARCGQMYGPTRQVEVLATKIGKEWWKAKWDAWHCKDCFLGYPKSYQSRTQHRECDMGSLPHKGPTQREDQKPEHWDHQQMSIYCKSRLKNWPFKIKNLPRSWRRMSSGGHWSPCTLAVQTLCSERWRPTLGSPRAQGPFYPPASYLRHAHIWLTVY